MIIVLACIMIPCIGIIAVGYFGFNMVKQNLGPFVGCAMSYEAVRDGVIDYTKDHDGKLPSAETWQDDVKPYYKKVIAKNRDEYGPFKPIDADGEWGCKTSESDMTGMAFNSNLSGKKIDDIKDPESTILIFEIEKAMHNAHAPYKLRSKSSSPLFFGKPRGWLEWPIRGDNKGDFDFSESNGQVKIRTKMGTSDKSSDDSENSDSTAPQEGGDTEKTKGPDKGTF